MPILMHQMRISTNLSPFSDAQVEKMEIREQKRQSDIILLWKALDKEMVMFYKVESKPFYKPVVVIKKSQTKKPLTWSKFYSDSGQENFDLLTFERLTK
jgi:hypothetical protein